MERSDTTRLFLTYIVCEDRGSIRGCAVAERPGAAARFGISLVVALMMTTGTGIGAGATTVAKKPTARAAKQFLEQLERALRKGDADFLLEHLDRAVLKRYGKAECRAFTETLKDPTTRFTPTQVTGPDEYEYVTDSLSTTVRKVFSIDVDTVSDGEPGESTVHVKANAWFTDCGTPLPPSTAEAVIAAAKRFEGHFEGTWTNLTFGSTGTSEMTLKVDAERGTVTVTSGLAGNVFGAPAPAPETLEAELDLTNIGAPVTVTSKTFGPVSIKLQPDGSLVVEALDVPGANVNTFRLVVSLTGDQVEGTYTVGLASGTTANGTVALTRV